jgi:hypothetical protein
MVRVVVVRSFQQGGGQVLLISKSVFGSISLSERLLSKVFAKELMFGSKGGVLVVCVNKDRQQTRDNIGNMVKVDTVDANC